MKASGSSTSVLTCSIIVHRICTPLDDKECALVLLIPFLCLRSRKLNIHLLEIQGVSMVFPVSNISSEQMLWRLGMSGTRPHPHVTLYVPFLLFCNAMSGVLKLQTSLLQFCESAFNHILQTLPGFICVHGNCRLEPWLPSELHSVYESEKKSMPLVSPLNLHLGIKTSIIHTYLAKSNRIMWKGRNKRRRNEEEELE